MCPVCTEGSHLCKRQGCHIFIFHDLKEAIHLVHCASALRSQLFYLYKSHKSSAVSAPMPSGRFATQVTNFNTGQKPPTKHVTAMPKGREALKAKGNKNTHNKNTPGQWRRYAKHPIEDFKRRALLIRLHQSLSTLVVGV